MPTVPEPTPNPNAMKFVVGAPVGGPNTYTPANAGDHPVAAALLEVEGVASVFFTADFVTVTKSPEAEWDPITESAVDILDAHYP